MAAAVRSIPAGAAAAGLPTASQLEARFETVKQAAGELAYFPPGALVLYISSFRYCERCHVVE